MFQSPATGKNSRRRCAQLIGQVCSAAQFLPFRLGSRSSWPTTLSGQTHPPASVPTYLSVSHAMRKVVYIGLLALVLTVSHILITYTWYSIAIRGDGYVSESFDGWYFDSDGFTPVVAMKYYIYKVNGDSSYDYVFVFPWVYSSAKGLTLF